MTRPTILGAIRERVLLADGGMGTQLLEAGLEAGRAGAEWNIAYPDRVRSVQSAYVAAGADILILVLDYYGTHKTPQVRAWLVKRPRFHVHFTPTYGSWLNQVERWFAELTNKQLRRGVHRSVRALETAIREFSSRCQV